MIKSTVILATALMVVLTCASPIKTVNAQLTREDPFAHLLEQEHTDPLTKAILRDDEAKRYMAGSIKKALYLSSNQFNRYEKADKNPRFSQKAIKDILKIADVTGWRKSINENQILHIAPQVITNVSMEESKVKNGIYTWTASLDVSFLLAHVEGQNKDSKKFRVIMRRNNQGYLINHVVIDSVKLIE